MLPDPLTDKRWLAAILLLGAALRLFPSGSGFRINTPALTRPKRSGTRSGSSPAISIRTSFVFDPRSQSFGDPQGRTPHWLVIPESPLRLYAAADPAVHRLARERYTPVFTVRGTRTLDSGAVYDQQDAFFLPFSRFWEVERPGPTITIYRRND